MNKTRMIKSSVTINLAASVKTGPWIFHELLEISLPKAAAMGFDGVELFTASADAVDSDLLKRLLQQYALHLSAAGTGAGKVIHGLTLTDPDAEKRRRAIAYIKEMITFASLFGAPAIIGSMQGYAVPDIETEESFNWLVEGLNILGAYAQKHEVALLFEPLNRYETNLINRLEAGVNLIDRLNTRNVTLLADLFHMNIEEASIPEAIRNFGRHIGFVHFADSNRRPVGNGHIRMKEIAAALKDIKYDGYVSAEAFPYPDPDRAAKTTIENFNKYFIQDEIQEIL